MGAEAKAQGLTSVVQAIKHLASLQSFAALLASLSPEARDFVTTPPTAGTWVPIEYQDEIMKKALEVCYGGDLTRCEEQGELQADRDFRTVYRAFVKLLDPEFVLRRCDLIWQTFYRNNGHVHVREWKRQNGWALLEIEGIAIPSPAYWAHQLGSIRHIARLTRLRDATAKIVEGGGHEPRAVLRFDWAA